MRALEESAQTFSSHLWQQATTDITRHALCSSLFAPRTYRCYF